MTDKIKGFVVTLKKETRDDDCEILIKAISLLKGVASVKPELFNFNHQMAVEKAKSDLRSKILELIL